MCDRTGCGRDSGRPLPAVSDAARRRFLKGLAALPLATVLAYPELARAAAGRLDAVAVPTPAGRTALGALAVPARTPAPAVLLIPEWWGLNDQIKAVAQELAGEGYLALAADIYDGSVATTRAGAMALVRAFDAEAGLDKLTALADWLKGHESGTGKVGTIGWCFGGGWSLNVSLATPVDATVIYYGDVAKSAAELRPLASPVLGHFATRDARINADMVSGFEAAMDAAGKTDLAVHWYDADHAFANPTGSRYDAEDASLAWARTLAFFAEHLG
jgi:carboxymethylenebutenolidase